VRLREASDGRPGPGISSSPAAGSGVGVAEARAARKAKGSMGSMSSRISWGSISVARMLGWVLRYIIGKVARQERRQ